MSRYRTGYDRNDVRIERDKWVPVKGGFLLFFFAFGLRLGGVRLSAIQLTAISIRTQHIFGCTWYVFTPHRYI